MKKIFLSIAFIATGLVASAQVGVGTVDPKVSLQVDKSAVATEADGVLVPRVTVAELNTKAGAYGEDQNGTLVFVTATAGAANETSAVTATGFHYYDFASDKWIAMKGAAGANIYSDNGTLAGVRTVTQANNNLTFSTGTARTIVDGTLQFGGLYGNIRSLVLPVELSDWDPNGVQDFTIMVTGSGTIKLPSPTGANSGRIISIRNNSTAARNYETNTPVNNSSITNSRGHLIQSNGTSWFVIGGF